MIESESDDELSEKEDEKDIDCVNNQIDFSPNHEFERASIASGSVIIKSQSRLSIDKGIVMFIIQFLQWILNPM